MKTKTRKPSAPKTAATQNRELDSERIAIAAYFLWEQAGRPDGQDIECWLRAENLLRQASSPA